MKDKAKTGEFVRGMIVKGMGSTNPTFRIIPLTIIPLPNPSFCDFPIAGQIESVRPVKPLRKTEIMLKCFNMNGLQIKSGQTQSGSVKVNRTDLADKLRPFFASLRPGVFALNFPASEETQSRRVAKTQNKQAHMSAYSRVWTL